MLGVLRDETENTADLGQEEDFFDAAFLSELEELAASRSGPAQAGVSIPAALGQQLAAFLAPPHGSAPDATLTEADFVGLTSGALAERTNALIETCRQGGKKDAVQAIENFIVFFQALVGTLRDDVARDVKRLFFRLAPTLLHIAYNDFSDKQDVREEGREALHNLGRILTEISGVRLTPSESELVFRNIDQMTGFISVGEYSVAKGIISSQLLGIISRNRIARSLYRLMEVEVSIQVYLKEKMGYPTPQIRVPADIPTLAEYGPIQVFQEESPDGGARRFIQLHLPDIPILRDVVLVMVAQDTGETRELRLDSLGSVELTVPDGGYSLGLVYKPLE